MTSGASLGIYIHIPFCQQKCPYCDFYSLTGTAEDYDQYIQKVIELLKAYQTDGVIQTLYFGGGTPSLMGAQRLTQVVKTVRECFTVSEDWEVTLEANPVSWLEKDYSSLVAGGFNRISFGVQSTNPQMLKTLGRLHSREEAFRSILTAKENGFDNISADLMVGVPGQTLGEIEHSLAELSALPITHLSIYLLKLEEGTAFFSRYPTVDDDFQSDCYELVVEETEKRGFHQYEISNFSKSGYESRHNLRYWQLADYIGIGPSAHSMVKGQRFYFPPSLPDFMAGGWGNIVEDGGAGGLEEEIMLSLRLKTGLNLEKIATIYGEKIGDHLKNKAQLFIQMGLMEREEETLSLTVKGFLISNTIILNLLEDIS